MKIQLFWCLRDYSNGLIILEITSLLLHLQYIYEQEVHSNALVCLSYLIFVPMSLHLDSQTLWVKSSLHLCEFFKHTIL